jgi:hypothetical protein
VNQSVLPKDSEELGDLLVSGDMSSQQVDEFIEQHGHYVGDCDEICQEIIDSFDDYPLVLLLEHNALSLTTEQSLLVHEKLDSHVVPEDQGTRANIASEKIGLSVGRGLFAYVASDLKDWLDEEFLESTYSEEEIQERVRRYLLDLAAFPECKIEILKDLVAAYHEPGNWRSGGSECDGEVETCESCQEMLSEASSKLK